MGKFVNILSIIALVLLSTCQTVFSQVNYLQENGDNSFSVISDIIVYDNNNHSAFTALESFNGSLYLAFREGKSHVASEGEEVIIKVLEKSKDKWEVNHIFHVDGIDIRDPFLIKWDNRLFMYAVGYYSELTETGWTPLVRINHNAPHYLNIWKMREYKGVLYGIGNAHNKWPILLTSTDGVNWNMKEEFKLGGNATEADMCFIKDKVYICFRVEEPHGSMSYFGTDTYPFNNIKWSVMDISVASPELISISNKRILLAGREYDVNSKSGQDGQYVSIFTINKKGEVLGRIRSTEIQNGDKGYPSFCKHNGRLYMSYYSGIYQTNIHFLEIKVK